MKTAKIELMILYSEFKSRLYSYVHCIVLKKNVLVIVWTHLLCCSNILVLQKHSLFEYSGW